MSTPENPLDVILEGLRELLATFGIDMREASTTVTPDAPKTKASTSSSSKASTPSTPSTPAGGGALKSALGGSRFLTASKVADLADVARINAQAQRMKATGRFGKLAAALEQTRNASEWVEMVGKAHKSTEHPGWLGRLVQHGHMMQMLFAKYQLDGRYYGPDAGGKDADNALERFFEGNKKQGYIRNRYVRRFAEDYPPLWYEANATPDGGTDYDPKWWKPNQYRISASYKEPYSDVFEPFLAFKQKAKQCYNGAGGTSRFQGFYNEDNAPITEALLASWPSKRFMPASLYADLLRNPKADKDSTKLGALVDRIADTICNARWLVWAAESWRCAASYTEDLSGSSKSLLARWRRHCMLWGIGPAGSWRFNNRQRFSENDVSTGINPSRGDKDGFSAGKLLELVMVNTPPPGVATWADYEGSVADWSDYASGRFKPPWRSVGYNRATVESMLKSDYINSSFFRAGVKAAELIITIAIAYLTEGIGTAISGWVSAEMEAFANGKIGTALRVIQERVIEFTDKAKAQLDILGNIEQLGLMFSDKIINLANPSEEMLNSAPWKVLESHFDDMLEPEIHWPYGKWLVGDYVVPQPEMSKTFTRSLPK